MRTSLCSVLLAVASLTAAQPADKPLYPDATWAGESLRLENSGIRVMIHKRPTGWGWLEIFHPGGKLMGVLDHFGEVDPVEDNNRLMPLRLEAQGYRQENTGGERRFVFPVKARWYEALNVRFWANPKLAGPFLEGEFSIAIDRLKPLIRLNYSARALRDVALRSFRAVWLKPGAASFGAEKHDAIFPGVEWLNAAEWSSGTDYHRHPLAAHFAPHPFKVAAPVISLSHGGTAVAVSWDPREEVAPGKRYPQPVFASPNFIDKVNNHLIGLMAPSAAGGRKENLHPFPAGAEEPALIELKAGQAMRLSAEVFLAGGDSFDAFMTWVRAKGLPEPPRPRYSFRDALDRIARAYNTHLWIEGSGWGGLEAQGSSPQPPIFLDRYVKENPGSEVARGLAEKLAWALKQPTVNEPSREGIRSRANTRRYALLTRDKQLAWGRQLLSYQQADGSFRFDPGGRHTSLLVGTQHYEIAEAVYKPLGRAGETALDLNTHPAMELLILARLTGEKSFAEGARKALDYCLDMRRPEGGDWWETPLYSPNLLAAGHSAIAYYLGYGAFHDRRYLDRAVYWLRTMLTFTHLWQPEEVVQLYDTKPCYNSTNWYGNSWVNTHVLWQILRIFAMSAEQGIDWAAIDQEVDWHRYHRGITIAGLRWMLDHQDPALAASYLRARKQFQEGLYDTLLVDTHSPISGSYGGLLIEPHTIGINLYALLDKEEQR